MAEGIEIRLSNRIRILFSPPSEAAISKIVLVANQIYIFLILFLTHQLKAQDVMSGARQVMDPLARRIPGITATGILRPPSLTFCAHNGGK